MPLSVVAGKNSAISQEQSSQREDNFRLLVESVQDYAILLLDPNGIISTWNIGAERIKGYKADEIIGQHFSKFYTREAKESGWPDRELEMAAVQGRFTDEGWRVRKDGTSFWASVVITALHGPDGKLKGFAKVTRDLTERRALEERTQELNRELRGRMNQLMESRSQLEIRTLELQRLSGQLLRIQDDERRRIARDLHDDLGQHLTALKMALEDKGREVQADDQLIKLTDGALQKVRNLSYLLHPPLLDESGLLPAIHWYLEGLKKRSHLNINFNYEPMVFPRLSNEIETSIFRILQESLTNVYRHSGSQDVRIDLHQQADRVIVRVRDFGKGIESGLVTGLQLPVGVGIGGMRERLKQFGGELRVLRAEPGTLVEAIIPLFSEPSF
jgi:PAS domain S-box-containing protein